MDSTQPPGRLTREERLAAQLRTNLRRRKQQARALGQEQPAEVLGEPGSKAALVKPVADG